MSPDIAGLIAQARTAVAHPAPKSDQRAQLERIAQEFESMLLAQALKGLRVSASWDGDQKAEGLGAEAFADTIDTELARHLSHVQGVGLVKQLLEAFDRLVPGAAGAPEHPEPVAAHRVAAAGPADVRPAAADGNSDLGLAVTSAYGWRQDPITGTPRFHRGIDLRAAYGQDVMAVGAGRVIHSGEQRGYGMTVVIEHADGTRSRYAHLSATVAPAGTMVSAGQVVGRAGHSGRATGTHLHFEVTGPDGQPLPPDRWLHG